MSCRVQILLVVVVANKIASMTMKLHKFAIAVVLIKSLGVVFCSNDFVKGLPPSSKFN